MPCTTVPPHSLTPHFLPHSPAPQSLPHSPTSQSYTTALNHNPTPQPCTTALPHSPTPQSCPTGFWSAQQGRTGPETLKQSSLQVTFLIVPGASSEHHPLSSGSTGIIEEAHFKISSPATKLAWWNLSPHI